jgi:hypothetical protein
MPKTVTKRTKKRSKERLGEPKADLTNRRTAPLTHEQLSEIGALQKSDSILLKHVYKFETDFPSQYAVPPELWLEFGVARSPVT